MNRAIAKDISIARDFEPCHYTGCDGYPTARVFSPVGITLTDGRMFFMPMGKRVQDEDGLTGYIPRYDAEQLIKRIEANNNVVDLDHWIEVPPFNFEEEMAIAAELEARDRYEHTGSYFGW